MTGFELVADGLVSDIIRRIAVFGMTLVPLDIREESTRHTLALDAITRYLGIGSYKVRLHIQSLYLSLLFYGTYHFYLHHKEWDEEARLSWLQSELNNKRPLFRIRDIEQNVLGLDSDTRKTLMVNSYLTSSIVQSLENDY